MYVYTQRDICMYIHKEIYVCIYTKRYMYVYTQRDICMYLQMTKRSEDKLKG
jgi:hypothetical protein